MFGIKIALLNIPFCLLLAATINQEIQGQKTNELDSLRKIYKESVIDSTRLKALLEIANIIKKENPDSAYYLYQKLNTLVDSVVQTRGNVDNQDVLSIKCKGLLFIGQIEFRRGKYSVADTFFHYAGAIAQQIRTPECTYLYYNHLGNLEDIKGNYIKAEECMANALEASKSLNNEKEIGTAYFNFGNLYQKMEKYDSAVSSFSNCIIFFEKAGDLESIADAYDAIGGIYEITDNYSKAFEYRFQSLSVYEKQINKNGIAKIYNNLGILYFDIGEYGKSMQFLLNAIRLFSELKDTSKLSVAFYNIGNTHFALREYVKSLDYHLKSLEIEKNKNSINDIASSYVNISQIYIKLNNLEKANEYLNNALELFLKDSNQCDLCLSVCYTGLGEIHKLKHELQSAIEFYKKSLQINIENGYKSYAATDYLKLSKAFTELANEPQRDDGLRNNFADSAKLYAINGWNLAVEIDAIPIQNEAAKILLEIYKRNQKYKNALHYAEIYISTRDSMFSEEKTNAIAEMTTKYETEKKQLEIDNLNKENELNQSEILRQNEVTKRQKTTIFYSILCLVLIACFALFVIHRLRITKRQKLVIEEQNGVLIQQKEEIIAQRDEIEAQRDMVVEQKNFIENQKKEIDDSIEYAKRIQTALLPSNVMVNKILGEHFILFKPRNTVSGDFYWVTQINDCLVVAVADCTGHGVPGAFMSMLGISFLNEIVQKKETISPNVILSELRTAIIDSLGQTNTIGAQKDGMDISLATINKNTKECVWAGANNPLLVLRKQNSSNPVIEEYKPDKMPISVHIKMTDFTNNAINLDSGDRIYLFSDGYSDQFGGIDGKKFKYSKFKELICNTVALPIEEQGQRIELEIKQWMHQNGNTFEQTDDITVLGICIA